MEAWEVKYNEYKGKITKYAENAPDNSSVLLYALLIILGIVCQLAFGFGTAAPEAKKKIDSLGDTKKIDVEADPMREAPQQEDVVS